MLRRVFIILFFISAFANALANISHEIQSDHSFVWKYRFAPSESIIVNLHQLSKESHYKCEIKGNNIRLDGDVQHMGLITFIPTTSTSFSFDVPSIAPAGIRSSLITFKLLNKNSRKTQPAQVLCQKDTSTVFNVIDASSNSIYDEDRSDDTGTFTFIGNKKKGKTSKKEHKKRNSSEINTDTISVKSITNMESFPLAMKKNEQKIKLSGFDPGHQYYCAIDGNQQVKLKDASFTNKNKGTVYLNLNLNNRSFDILSSKSSKNLSENTLVMTLSKSEVSSDATVRLLCQKETISDSLTRELKSEEQLGHVLAYKNKKKYKVTEANGTKREYRSVFLKTDHDGLVVQLLIPTKIDPNEVVDLKILPRGSHRGASWIRNIFEPGGPGSETLDRNIKSLITQVLTHMEDLKRKHPSIGFNLTFSGHSLGGTDAAGLKIAFLEQLNFAYQKTVKKASSTSTENSAFMAVKQYTKANPDREVDPRFGTLLLSIQKMKLATQNSPGSPSYQEEKAELFLEGLRGRIKTGKFESEVSHWKVGGDPVQTAGYAVPFANISPELSTVKVYKRKTKEESLWYKFRHPLEYLQLGTHTKKHFDDKSRVLQENFVAFSNQTNPQALQKSLHDSSRILNNRFVRGIQKVSNKLFAKQERSHYYLTDTAEPIKTSS